MYKLAIVWYIFLFTDPYILYKLILMPRNKWIYLDIP